MFIPRFVTNGLFLLTFYLSIYQHLRLKRPNPVLNLQFIMMVFALAMVVIVALYNQTGKWLSTAFLVVAAGCLAFMYRQMRYLPHKERYD